MRYAVVIENEGSNFSAYVPDLPGCVATGATLADTEDGPPIPAPSSRVEYIEVAA